MVKMLLMLPIRSETNLQNGALMLLPYLSSKTADSELFITFYTEETYMPFKKRFE